MQIKNVLLYQKEKEEEKQPTPGNATVKESSNNRTGKVELDLEERNPRDKRDCRLIGCRHGLLKGKANFA